MSAELKVEITEQIARKLHQAELVELVRQGWADHPWKKQIRIFYGMSPYSEPVPYEACSLCELDFAHHSVITGMWEELTDVHRITYLAMAAVVEPVVTAAKSVTAPINTHAFCGQVDSWHALTTALAGLDQESVCEC